MQERTFFILCKPFSIGSFAEASHLSLIHIYVSLFHVGKSKENPLYACGCIAGNSGRYDRKCGDRFLYVDVYKRQKLYHLNLTEFCRYLSL